MLRTLRRDIWTLLFVLYDPVDPRRVDPYAYFRSGVWPRESANSTVSTSRNGRFPIVPVVSYGIYICSFTE